MADHRTSIDLRTLEEVHRLLAASDFATADDLTRRGGPDRLAGGRHRNRSAVVSPSVPERGGRSPPAATLAVAYLAPPPAVGPGTTTARSDPGIVDLGPSVTVTRIVLDRDLSPLDRLDGDERRRLLVRVLCGLVAYDDEPAPARLAG